MTYASMAPPPERRGLDRSSSGDHRPMICPDCDIELEPVADDGQTSLRPGDDWACPDCGARWHLEYSWLMTEVD